ncbi:uncharacterized protein A1O9_06563 [Exophiala aquamarina CBS 119918]|uniref:Uncharacterized protein n=1 Tax=Exophiala aquamarina CBS 119918 TaxID=1182545 RepID=A0A072PFU8_9EURO|nr:uncharacterized protein A1O9_06563 [Exophiala aquamarina CBS 119918]KEF58637.1 hypothetical protein A1O9_06563 [Exophiala aquamarina CBS 119918]
MTALELRDAVLTLMTTVFCSGLVKIRGELLLSSNELTIKYHIYLGYGASGSRSALPWTKLGKYQKRVSKIDRDVVRIEKTIQDQWDLKRTHASIKDPRPSLILSVALTGFTVITINFTPLAFAVSHFAQPLDRSFHDQVHFGGTSGTTEAMGRTLQLPILCVLRGRYNRDGDRFLGGYYPSRDNVLKEFLYELAGYDPKQVAQTALEGGSRSNPEQYCTVTSCAKAMDKNATIQTVSTTK